MAENVVENVAVQSDSERLATVREQNAEASREFPNLSSKQYDDWRKTGEIPAEESSAEATSVHDRQQKNGAEDAKPVVDDQEKPKLTKMGYGDLRKHSRQLEDENAQLRAEIERFRPTQQPIPPQDGGRQAQGPERQHGQHDPAAMEKAREAAVWVERCSRAQQDLPDFNTVFDPNTGVNRMIGADSPMERFILHSPEGPRLLHYFQTNQSEFQRIGSMSTRNQAEAYAFAREMTRLEERLNAPREFRTTKAPPPTREVGGRGTAVVDDVTKAVADDDTGAYIKAANRRDISRSKRSR